MFQIIKTLVAMEVLLIAGLFAFRTALVPTMRGIVIDAKVVILTLLTPAVGLFCGNLFIFCAYLAVAVAFSARSRAELCSIYFLMLPMVPLLELQTNAGDRYLFALSTVVAMNAGALIGVVITRGRSLAGAKYDIAAAGLIGIFVYIYSRDVSATAVLRTVTVQVLALAAPYLIVSRGLARGADLERALLRLALAGTMAAFVGMFQAARGWVLYQTMYDALGVQVPLGSATLAVRAGLLRTGGPMIDYSAGGLFLAVVLSTMPALRERFNRLTFWGVVLILLGGLFVSQSRGAWLSAIAGIGFVLVHRGLAWRALVGAAGMALALVVAWQSIERDGRIAAMIGKEANSAGTVDYRQRLAQRGFELIREHPLTGQPPDVLVSQLPDLVQGQHIVDFVNSHLFVAMAAGIPFFLVWCIVWLLPVIDGWRMRRRRGEAGHLVEVPGAIVVTAMAGLVATSLVDRNLIWPTIALGLAAPCAALARRRAIPAADRHESTTRRRLVWGLPESTQAAPATG